MKESLRDEIKKKFHLKTTGIILKSSRRDTTIVNCHFSIVNSLNIPFPNDRHHTIKNAVTEQSPFRDGFFY